MKQLGVNAFRIHVWDREVSDRQGNLLDNEHMQLLDYLLARLIENDIYIILTPVAWWGTGWPEPDMDTPGFSSGFSKIELSTNPQALEIQKNYMRQFVNHKNAVTGKQYKNEEKIIAFELVNEPNLPKDSVAVTAYINQLVTTVRNEGVTKPLFFNISENPFKEAWCGVANADIQGISFQWYPTGLVKNSELKGNFLPHVSSYPLPEYSLKTAAKAKMVYEFDAADILSPVMYPAMAHSFRQAGMQWATMFCYDPTPIAQYNAEYPTHFLNLYYTPQKAISFLIAAELFKSPALAAKTFTDSTIVLGNTSLNYPELTSLLNSGEKYYYSNSTDVIPVHTESLKKIAGCGNSPVVQYSGNGAYFIEWQKDNEWLIEIYPDAVPVSDPFGKNGLQKPVSSLMWKKHRLSLSLPGIDSNFTVFDAAEGSNRYSAVNSAVDLLPGRYIITNNKNYTVPGHAAALPAKAEFTAHSRIIEKFDETEICNNTVSEIRQNKKLIVSADVYTPAEAAKVFVFLKRSGWRGYQKSSMETIDGKTFQYQIPENLTENGLINYYISVNSGNEWLTFPGKETTAPDAWDFNGNNSYALKILPGNSGTVVFEPVRDFKNIITANIWKYVETVADLQYAQGGEAASHFSVQKIKEPFPELAMQIYTGGYLKNLACNKGDKIKIGLSSTSASPFEVEARFIFNDGSAFVEKLPVNPEFAEHEVVLREPEPCRYALLPRPYPLFMPYWFSTASINAKNNSPRLESIQFAIPLTGSVKNNAPGIAIKKIVYIEK
ncbi:MAG: cellulase family glycosylhydrolase [Ignavibacteriales bacterium]|nr:cellulase family glycosylhydrolase [Ignavibacteriales bacterium]